MAGTGCGYATQHGRTICAATLLKMRSAWSSFEAARAAGPEGARPGGPASLGGDTGRMRPSGSNNSVDLLGLGD